MKTLVLYHAQCADGFCSAFVYWLHKDSEAEFVAVQHSQDKIDLPDVLGRNVVILDFTYPRDVMLAINNEAKSFFVIDHHPTGKDRLDGIEHIFDLERSAAQITWDWLVWRGSKRNWLVNYTADRDLWKWQLTASKAVNASLRSYPFDFELWEDLSWGDPIGHIGPGEAILRREKQIVDAAVSQAYEIMFLGHKVLVVNSTTNLGSEIGHELAKDRPFGVTYFDTQTERVFSLRSIGDFDVSEIAKKFGGGGHKNAAGFRIPMTQVELRV